MSIGNPWPFLAINLACFAAGWLILLASPFYRRHVHHVAAGRAQMLDGLRGWLALGVFFAHAVTTYFYYTEGKWDATGAPLYSSAGQLGVCLFFMITGFLFWTRVVRSQGILDVTALYSSRIKRIVPMYIVSVLMALAVVAALSGFSLRVDPVTLARELRSWFSFGFMHAGELNGVADAHYINAVYWTLAYEWVFYLSLPCLALFWKGARSVALFAVAFVFCLRMPVTVNFLFGAAAAVIVERRLLRDWLAGAWMTPLPLLLLAAAFAFPSAYGLAPMLLLFLFFLFIVHGNSLFGLLASGGARLLGTISYSIYLVHCISVFVVMRVVNAYRPIATLDPLEYWVYAGVAAVTAVLVSAVTYRYVEHPCLSSKLTLAAIELAASRKLAQLGAGLPARLRLRVARLWHYMSARGAGARER